jgi:hypothetical protein
MLAGLSKSEAPMSVRDDILARLYGGADPFTDFPEHLFAFDTQGWQSQHPYLSRAIDAGEPKVIVEIGVWKGGSTLFMAEHLRTRGFDAVVIAVDTWLGSWDHWVNPELRKHLAFRNGYPNFFYKFMNNVRALGLQNYVVPLPLDSVNARETLRHFGLAPDMLHIDAGHDYLAVSTDIAIWWDLLRPGGYLVGDDYAPTWPGVVRAFDEFAARVFGTPVEHVDGKCIFQKPAGLACA